MAKPKMNKEQLEQKLTFHRKVLLDKFSDILELFEDNKSILMHKSLTNPSQFYLFVSMHPKVSKFIVGIKSTAKSDRDSILNIYDNLPLDLKGRLHKAQKYIAITDEIKFIDLNENILRLIDQSINFYKESFREFLN